MNAPLDLKSTVNLPKTGFPMKANLPQREPEMLRRWEESRLYQQIRAARRDQPIFVLHDGPPYANGNIHMGTALNKIVKDFIVKSRTMLGYDSPYVPGWDCHGLPIEIKVDQELGPKKAGMSAYEIRQECRKYAEKYVDLQREDFKRLGVLGEWDRPYLTMSAGYQATIAGAFVTFLEKGYVYKGQRPVNWCIFDRTALAEAEVEYEDHTSPSVWVSYVESAGGSKRFGEDVRAIIWTTTPWTLPASMALTVHPDFRYVVREASDGHAYLFAQDLAGLVSQKTGLEWGAERGEVSGRELEGLKFVHPFVEREVPVIVGPHVTLEQGSGIVHTAPGHGYEDFVVGRQNGIAIFCPVDGDGRFTPEAGPELAGRQVFEANALIVDIVKRHGALLASETVRHSYPHCWRCHNPTIFRATEQWFIGMERNELRSRALEEVKKVRWSPQWGEDRIFNMIASRPDWCISRQRSWGVPLVIFYCNGCGEWLSDLAALRHTVSIFAKETADAWYLRPSSELLPPGTKCAKCGGREFRKETDILDVWFDSGSSHLATLGYRPDMPWPADEYMEGADQYRGWFHSSLLVGVGTRNAAPYRSVATNGWVLDADGRAMHKHLGNVVAPQEVWNKYGAELLRLAFASVDFREDIRYSEETMTRNADAYRKIRNTFRFMLGNLYDFSIERDAVPASAMLEIDRWVMARTADMAERCRGWYEEELFHRVYHAVYDFCTVELSSFYLDVLKDRLYTSAPNSRARRSAQTAIYRVLNALLRLLAPLLSFTCDEAWGFLARPAGEPDSVHLTVLPEAGALREGLAAGELERLKAWDRLFVVRSQVLKALEDARNEKVIGSGLEARVRLGAEGDWTPLLQQYAAQLPSLFIVSQVQLADGLPGGRHYDVPGLRVAVERASGKKCERCWNFSEHVGENKAYPTVCERCAAALDEIATAGQSQAG